MGDEGIMRCSIRAQLSPFCNPQLLPRPLPHCLGSITDARFECAFFFLSWLFRYDNVPHLSTFSARATLDSLEGYYSYSVERMAGRNGVSR